MMYRPNMLLLGIHSTSRYDFRIHVKAYTNTARSASHHFFRSRFVGQAEYRRRTLGLHNCARMSSWQRSSRQNRWRRHGRKSVASSIKRCHDDGSLKQTITCVGICVRRMYERIQYWTNCKIMQKGSLASSLPTQHVLIESVQASFTLL